MSWFKGAIEKVKEKGASVRGIALDVVNRGREISSRITGSVSGKELEATLELRAVSVSSCQEISELCLWVINEIGQSSKTNYTIGMSRDERGIRPIHILLRSRMIEILLETIITNPSLRGEIAEAWLTVRDESEHSLASQVAAISLFRLLRRTMDGSETEWYNTISLLFSEGLPVEAGLSMIELIGQALKRDWYEAWLRTEIEILQGQAESMRNASVTDPWEKLTLSNDRVDTLAQMRDDINTLSLHRRERREYLESFLSSLKTKCERMVKETSPSTVSLEIRAQKGMTDIEFGRRLDDIAYRRADIDSKLDSLYAEQDRFRIELDRVTNEIEETLKQQRMCLQEEENVRDELIVSKANFENLIQIQQMTMETARILSDFSNISTATIDLIFAKLPDRFADSTDDEFSTIESVQDHIALISGLVQESFRRIKRASDEIDTATRSLAYSIQSVEEEAHEFSASEDHTKASIERSMNVLSDEALDLAKLEESSTSFFGKFELNSNRLIQGEIEKFKVLLSESTRILQRHLGGRVTRAVPPSTEMVDDIEG
jgi:hypothetical protein